MATYGVEKVPIGSSIKMAINFGYKGTDLTLDDIDDATFTYFSTGSLSGGAVLNKADLIRRETTANDVSTVEWFAIVDTNLVGKGQMQLKVEARIPDTDLGAGETRPEIAIVDTNVVIV